jgi:transposase
MLTLPASVRIFLAVEPVDLRRGHDGLSAIVAGQWKLELFAGHLFVFLGRRRDRCKVLFWDRGGLVLYYKRLEKGRFGRPRLTGDGQAVELDATDLAMLLDGIDWPTVHRPAAWQPKRASRRATGIDKAIAV